MAKTYYSEGGSRHVYTSGTSAIDRALWDDTKPNIGGDSLGKASQLKSVQEPSPSQKYTYQRGLAKAALQLPEPEREPALAETLAMMGLYERVVARMI